ncbi:MAG: glycosyltransferase [Deltaproteobacteria bacterium]|nr:glycosyltransferase [Deltaproteobacteria bacterium]MBF0509233.1 glycosyltransferase [Deltaproteobacteria bacterium]MBF0525989.1 glycosyltransferase [Deltaproteobacteria bacterium]
MIITFWQNMPSHIQAPVIRALAERKDCLVNWVVENPIPEWRRKMGWDTPEVGQANLLVCPDAGTIKDLLAYRPGESVHIFSPDRTLPLVTRAFYSCLAGKGRLGLLSEAKDWRGWRGWARLALGQTTAWIQRWRIGFILAMGGLGVKWFQMCGYSNRVIFPYCYVAEPTESIPAAAVAQRKHDQGVNLIFIGQCIHRKGGDLLLKALAGLTHLDWQLEVIGDGTELTSWAALAAELQISDRVNFRGNYPNSISTQLLAAADLLILPSRWDGWGAVVNEALMQGVPVICSDKCGASDLLNGADRGEIFRAGSVDALRRALGRRISLGPTSPTGSTRIKQWSTAIQGDRMAGYLLQVLGSAFKHEPRPIPPWVENHKPPEVGGQPK